MFEQFLYRYYISKVWMWLESKLYYHHRLWVSVEPHVLTNFRRRIKQKTKTKEKEKEKLYQVGLTKRKFMQNGAKKWKLKLKLLLGEEL